MTAAARSRSAAGRAPQRTAERASRQAGEREQPAESEQPPQQPVQTTLAVRTEPAAHTAWSARGWAIYLGWIVITMDASGLNLALPTIAGRWHAHVGGVSWLIDAYTLPLASLLLLGGSLGDRLGAVRLFTVGAVGFAVATVACALSPSLAWLIALRAIQGVFAALLLPMLLALVGKSFTDSGQRSRAVNLMTVFGGAGMAVGPFLGGLLTDTVGWRAVFWLTAPIAVAAALLVGGEHNTSARPLGPRRSQSRVTQLDLPGQVSGTVGLIALVAGLIEVGRDIGAVLAWVLLAVSALFLLAFLQIERRAASPMMPLRVFRRAGFARAVGGGFAFQFGAYGLQFFLAVYLQTRWGISALAGGVLLAFFAVGVVLSSMLVNPFLLGRGNRAMIVIGSVIAAVGSLALLGVAGPHEQWLLIVAEFVIGTGSGIYSTALNRSASTSLGADAAGLASGIYNTSRQVGQCLGIAILGALAAAGGGRAGYVVAVALVAACALAITASQWFRDSADERG